jgi:hypothetical protein
MTTTSVSDEIKQELLLKFRTIITLLTLVKAPLDDNDGPSILNLNSNYKLPALNKFEKAVQKALKAFVDASTRNSEVLAAAGDIDEEGFKRQVAKLQKNTATSPPVNPAGLSARSKAKRITFDQKIPFGDVTVYQGTVTRGGVLYTPNADDRDSYIKPTTPGDAMVVQTGQSEWSTVKDVFEEVGKDEFLLKVQ